MKKTLAALAASSITLTAAPKQPNVVLIYGDDVGYGDVGAYGSKLIPTPHIDKLAAEGLRFTDGHCSAATCSPSRFSMLTGIHGFRHGVRVLPPNAPLTIPLDKITLPKLFKQAGYNTAVVGKWHLGIGKKGVTTNWNGDVKPGPLEIGFDYSFLLPSTNDRVPCVYLDGHRVLNLDPKDPLYVQNKKPEGFTGTVYPDGRKNREAMTYYQSSHGHNNSVINGIGRIGYMWGGKAALWNDETMSDTFVERTQKFLAKQKDAEKPFFLYFASADIHVPRAPHPRFQGKTTLGYRGDAMVQFDDATGQILKALKENGLEENTIVIFSSDNGPVYDDGYKDGTIVHTSTKEVDQGHDGSGIYRGGKYQIYEGGTRVPFIIKWPAKIKPGTSDALVNQIDFIASFAKLLNIDLADDQAFDSHDTLDALLGKSQTGRTTMLEEARGLALREGNWKLVQNPKKPQLYNLEKDPSEQNNIAKDHPEKVETLTKKIQQARQAKNGTRSLN